MTSQDQTPPDQGQQHGAPGITAADLERVRLFLTDLQSRYCDALGAVDGKAEFGVDEWQRDRGGAGISRVIADGAVFEKGGVNFSSVAGAAMPPAATVARPALAGKPFKAMGISVVMHPRNPFVPISHANFRLFVAGEAGPEAVWWFGGGYDLTPCYGFEDDCRHWHGTARNACESFRESLGADCHARLKKACDDYFYLKHRQEPRGIGGLFFDDFNSPDFATCFAFVQVLADSYLAAYLPIVERRKGLPFTARQRAFQEYRRGRYVEFNLVHDRGTVFGLQSGVGRIESILMSLPPVVRWVYDWQPQPGSEEARLLTDFLKPRDWL